MQHKGFVLVNFQCLQNGVRVIDGTQWDVELVYDDMKKNICGSNDFPKEIGRAHV